MSRITSVIINALLFAAGFFACLLLNTWLAVFITLTILLLHSRRIYPGEWRLLIQTAVLGWVFDAVLYRSAVLGPPGQLPEIWQISIWLLFATTLCHSLRFVQRYFALSLLIGPLLGVVLYGSQVLLSDVLLMQSWPVFLVTIALGWALLFPLLVFVGKTRVLNGVAELSGAR